MPRDTARLPDLTMEQQIIAWLKAHYPARPPVLIGIGDDAAVISVPDKNCVITTDAIVDGVHFRLAKTSWRRIGRKAIGVNLSDLAAMGATPVAIVVCLVLPQGTTLKAVQELYLGISELADQSNVQIAGGDTNFSSGPLMVNVVAIGTLPANRKAWTVKGATPGDVILVSGTLGGSLLGRHLDVEPRCALARYLVDRYTIHAATDVSDGLLFNLNVILQASCCGATIDLEHIPIADAARSLAGPKTPLEHALYDGEDFELILSVDPAESTRLLADPDLPCPLTKIGTIVAQPGIQGRRADGTLEKLVPHGFSHGELLPET